MSTESANLRTLEAPELSRAARRMRLSRERRRDGRKVVEMELRPTEVDALIAAGWLAEEKRDDRHAIEVAIGAMFDSAFITDDGRVGFPKALAIPDQFSNL